jgi:hypothetical protein
LDAQKYRTDMEASYLKSRVERKKAERKEGETETRWKEETTALKPKGQGIKCNEALTW